MSSEAHQGTSLAQKGNFDDNNPKYRLCCWPVRAWAMIIGIIEFFGIILQLISGIVSDNAAGGNHPISSAVATAALEKYHEAYATFLSNTRAGMIACIVAFIIWIIVVILLFYGVKKEKHLFLIPHMIVQIISIIGAIVMAIYYFVAAHKYGSQSSDKDNNQSKVLGVSIGGGVGLVIAALVEKFFLYAIYRCYKYLKEKNLAKTTESYQIPTAPNYAAVEKGRH